MANRTWKVETGRGFNLTPAEERRDIDKAFVYEVRKSVKGDGQAYARLMERHQAGIGAIMRRFARDRKQHEQLVQEVFVEAYLSPGRPSLRRSV